MIDDLGSYSVKNFVSFGEEVYFRFFERQFEAWWPAHLLMLAFGVAALLLALFGKNRATAIATAIPLAVCAITFHFELFAELTPVGKIFGWAFLFQAVLLLIWGFASKSCGKFRPTVPATIGAAIAAFGLAGYPLLILGTERKATGAELFGIAPDPTICVVLGIPLLCARPIWFLLLFPIPLLWTFATWGILDTFGAPFAITLPVISALTVTAAIWKATIRQQPRSSARR